MPTVAVDKEDLYHRLGRTYSQFLLAIFDREPDVRSHGGIRPALLRVRD